MTATRTPDRRLPRIESLSIRNYRALHNVQFKSITPLTVFLGPNGSGKSTVFDVFAFLSETFQVGLRRAWDKRGRFKDLRTRGAQGPIEVEVKYREPDYPLITYHLSIDETKKGPIVAEEWLRWSRKGGGKPFRFLDFKNGEGEAASGQRPDADDERQPEKLASSEMLAVSSLGQFAKHPRVSALRDFITGWYLSYLSAASAKSAFPEAGPQERLSLTGDNLANVIQYLREQHPERLEAVLKTLSRRIPKLEKVNTEMLADGRLLLQIKDAPFKEPILAKWASDGTLKMLAYLIVLYDPEPPALIGIEEPENFLHPRLLPELAEECRGAAARSQVMATSHSPWFVNGLRPEELWILYRDGQGFTNSRRVSDMVRIRSFLDEGAGLGELWLEGQFEVGDPFVAGGGPRPGTPGAS